MWNDSIERPCKWYDNIRDLRWENSGEKWTGGEHTVSGPVTLVGGGIDRKVLRSSGPGLFLDKRLRTWADDDKPTLLDGFAAKSNPWKYNEIFFILPIIGSHDDRFPV